jgi:hypothetical protein
MVSAVVRKIYTGNRVSGLRHCETIRSVDATTELSKRQMAGGSASPVSTILGHSVYGFTTSLVEGQALALAAT